jgi:hypothetical protein
MRINSSGNAGIGTSSPTYRLDVNSASTQSVARFSAAVTSTSQNNGGALLRIQNTDSTNGNMQSLAFTNSNDSSVAVIFAYNANHSTNEGFLTFGTRDSGGTFGERMRITSAGDVAIGNTSALTTSANRRVLTLNGTTDAMYNIGIGGTYTAYFYSNASGTQLGSATSIPLQFYTADTERMRLDSSGNFIIGNTSRTGSAKFETYQSANNEGMTITAANASYSNNALVVYVSRNTTNNSFNAFNYYNLGASASRFIIADSGNATNTNGSYGTISDVKLKENITDATSKLDKVNQLKVRNYNLIGSELKQIGFVAQEFEQVFPSMVEESPDTDKDNNNLGTTTKTIKTTVLIPILVKAIQEQQAIITQLQADVAALKGAK